MFQDGLAASIQFCNSGTKQGWSIPFLLELVGVLLDLLPHARVPLGRPTVVAQVAALLLWQRLVGGVGLLGEDIAEQFLERAVEGRRCLLTEWEFTSAALTLTNFLAQATPVSSMTLPNPWSAITRAVWSMWSA